MRLPLPRFTVRWLIIVLGLVGLALGLRGWMARRAEALRVEEVNRAIARQQIALIDEAWAILENLSRSGRINIDGGTIGQWGRRRLEALRRAGAGKAEIVAALEKYIMRLDYFCCVMHSMHNHHHPTCEEYEIKFLRMEAEIWLNEERGSVTRGIAALQLTPSLVETPAPLPPPPSPPVSPDPK